MAESLAAQRVELSGDELLAARYSLPAACYLKVGCAFVHFARVRGAPVYFILYTLYFILHTLCFMLYAVCYSKRCLLQGTPV